MIAVIESERFPRELAGWGLRGVLCAASSFWWALVSGFNSPAEIAGMAAGVIVWVALFAGFCVWQLTTGARGPAQLVPALKMAALIKFLLSAAGWAWFAICALFQSGTSVLDAGLFLMMPDCLLGMASLALVGALGGGKMDQLPRLDSFGWTALTTLVDGALFLVVIAALAGAVLLWWRFGPELRRKLKLSPTRCAG
jgi:hypothetical protein